jgi:excisionase family DNA binding protein|tara:strand:- start:783 stop:995 length:213 start_codon:yes stop_codon:yes gene_type:complete
MQQKNKLPGYVSIPGAAKMLGVTDSLVRRWVRQGRISHFNVGENIRLLPVDAVKAFAKIERKPGPKPAKY